MSKAIISVCAVAILTLIIACNKNISSTGRTVEPLLPAVAYDYFIDGPTGNFNNDEDVNDDVATLGRVLFYDEKLSANGSISCASCHKQQFAFADNKALSDGFLLDVTLRNSMPIINPDEKSAFFWDSRVTGIENQVLLPITNHIEMGINNMEALMASLQQYDYYQQLFNAAFGSSDITEERMAEALSTFLKTLTTHQSKFDDSQGFEFLWNDSMPPNFTLLEAEGFRLFKNEFHCTSCHGGYNLDGGSWANENIGLESDYEDEGIGSITNETEDNGVFKVPALRNVGFTAPYMHDGRFATLDDVLNHYSTGIVNHPNLPYTLREVPDDLADWLNAGFSLSELLDFSGDDDLSIFPPIVMNMTDAQKEALIAFLHTLDDHELIKDVLHSDPFVLVEN